MPYTTAYKVANEALMDCKAYSLDYKTLMDYKAYLSIQN